MFVSKTVAGKKRSDRLGYSNGIEGALLFLLDNRLNFGGETTSVRSECFATGLDTSLELEIITGDAR